LSKTVDVDFAEMQHKLKCYVDKGRLALNDHVEDEPLAALKPDPSLIRPLNNVGAYQGSFLAVDCSTRTLKRANNWGIYLMRTTYAMVTKRDVDWGFEERICTAVGDGYSRSNFLKDKRIELESQMALKLLLTKEELYYDHSRTQSYHDHTNGRSSPYLLLDGGGYFGGERRYRVSLYDKCQKEGIRLLAICKNSPTLRDEKGRDFLATVQGMASYGSWFYHPIKKADKGKNLYGDIAAIKLCSESPYVFRCDIMDYLTNQDISELLSPLTCVSEDPRCVGYPISLYLAHEFSEPSNSMLLSYHDRVEEKLNEAGLLETLRREERSCSFADQLHGVKHAFEREWWDDKY